MAPADEIAKRYKAGYQLILGALRKFDVNTRTQLRDTLSGLLAYTRSWISREVPAAYDEGRSGARGSDPTPIEPDTVHGDAVNDLAQGLYSRLSDNLVAVGRKADDAYREVTEASLGESAEAGESLTDAKKRMAAMLRSKGIGGYVDGAGREWTPDAYAGMATRTTLNEAHNLGLMNELEEGGYDLVEIPKNDTACPICARYEGRVYSISGSDARYPTLRGTAMQVGYHTIHPNCRHRLVPYYEELAADPSGDRRRSNRPFKEINGE